MAAMPKTYYQKSFPLKRFLFYLVALVLACSIGMLFIASPKLYIFDVIPFLLLIIVWIIFLVFFTKRQKSTLITLDELELRYIQHSDKLIIPWNEIKYFKRRLNRNGGTRNVIIVTYLGRLLLLGNFSEIDEIADYVGQHAKSLGKLSTVERIRLSPLTRWLANLISLAGLAGLIYFPAATRGHFLSLLILLGAIGLILLSMPSINAKAPRDLWKNRVKFFTLTLVIWIVVAIVLLIIFNSLYSSPH